MTTEKAGSNRSLLSEFVVVIYFVITTVLRAGLLWILPRSYKNIGNEVVLVTGGGKGIGRLLAVELAKHNPKHIILWGRHKDTLAATAKAIELSNVPCTYMVCDVGKKEKVFQMAKEVQETIGNVTMVINNAGVVFGNTVLESDPKDIQQTVETNAMSHIWTTKAFLPHMTDYDHGHIVFINSMLGLMGLGGAADYSASKFAGTGFAESLLMELVHGGHMGVHVTVIHPYMINTDMFAGCTTRFPRLFPPLDKEYVAWRTVDAILRNQNQVLMPKLMYFSVIARSIFPVKVLLALQQFIGVDKTMEGFHGRKKKKVPTATLR